MESGDPKYYKFGLYLFFASTKALRRDLGNSIIRLLRVYWALYLPVGRVIVSAKKML